MSITVHFVPAMMSLSLLAACQLPIGRHIRLRLHEHRKARPRPSRWPSFSRWTTPPWTRSAAPSRWSWTAPS